jgi:cytochrome c biogenesis protein
MSSTISTASRPAGAPSGVRLPGRRPLPPHTWAYRQLTSMRVALLLLGAIALLTLAGTLLEQAPAEIRGDAAAYAEWLDSVRPRYGGWTGVLDTLGLFAVFSSIWFKGLLVLLSASLISCSVRNVPRLWRKATRPRMVMTEAFFERAPHRAGIVSDADAKASLDAIRSTFRSHLFHTSIERDGDDVHVCADRFRWGPFGRIVAHLSFVVILIGAALTATSGFRDEGFAVPVGGKERVGHGTDLTVKATSFSDTYYLSGEPRDFASNLVLYKDGKPVKSQEVRVNHPMRYEGVSFYQSFFGPSVVLRAQDGDGRVLFDRGVPMLYGSKDETHVIGRFSLPEKGLTVFAVAPQSGEIDRRIGPGQAQLEVYRSGNDAPVGVRVLTQGKPAQIAGVDFTFVRERQYAGLIVARDPGWTLVWVGSVLLVIGICMVFMFPHRRIRAVVRRVGGGSEVGIAAIKRRDAAFATQFKDLVKDMRRAVQEAGAP